MGILEKTSVAPTSEEKLTHEQESPSVMGTRELGYQCSAGCKSASFSRIDHCPDSSIC